MRQCCALCLSVVLLTLPATAQDLGTRQPVPTKEAVAAAKKTVAEVYAEQYQRARTLDEKRTLAEKLLDDGRQTRNDAAGQYVLYLIARDLAAQAGDLELALQVVDQASLHFALDRVAWAEEAVVKAGEKLRPPQDPAALMGSLLQLATSATFSDNSAAATRFGKVAQQFARQVNNRLLARDLQLKLEEVQSLADQYNKVKPAFDALERDPVDPAANLAAGKFRAFVQERWAEGVPHLALGEDQELAALATQEISQPGDPLEVMKIADAWWDLAEKKTYPLRPLRRHAVDVYLGVLPRLTGLPAKRVETRLREAEKWHSKTATYVVSQLRKEYPPLPSLLNESEKFHSVGGTEFAFEIADAAGYIVIDLKRDTPISRIYVQNRPVNDRTRGSGIFLSSLAGDRGQLVWTAPNNAAEWNIWLPEVKVARYVTFARNPNVNGGDGWLHLRKIMIFGPE